MRIARKQSDYTDADGPYYELVIEFDHDVHDFRIEGGSGGAITIVIQGDPIEALRAALTEITS